MRVAAYQAPLAAAGSMDAVGLIQRQIKRCEAEGISVLCCPEAILGGLADLADDPFQFAIPIERLDAVLEPLASDHVTTIVGFTELSDGKRLYNSAAVFRHGSVIGVYRKLHPAIRRSVYQAGVDIPEFRVDALTFGVVICNDSNFPGPARSIAAQGATALFVPSNNGLPPAKGGPELVSMARHADIARAVENSLWVIRADVVGRAGALVSHGSSGIVDPEGTIVDAGSAGEALLVASLI